MSAHRAARALLRVRAWVIAAYALSAAAAFAALVGLARMRGWDGVGPATIAAAGVVCALWALPAIRLYRSAVLPPKTVQLAGGSAPELELLVRQLALQLQVPTPAGIELSPDCDAWLDPRPGGPVLVIGAPFLWWLRVSELRGLLAPLVAGMAAAGDERIVRARAFATRSIGALHGRPGRSPHVFPGWRRRMAGYFEARAESLERVVAWEAVAASRMIEPAARAYAHEQINMAAAGWDRVLTRLAQPAWESGYCPVGLNLALVGALTSLGRRDRMAGALATRLSERPACDLLEEPGDVDAHASRMAAELFEGRRIERTVTWERYVTSVTEPELVRRAAAMPEEHPAAKRIRTLIAEAGVPGARRGEPLGTDTRGGEVGGGEVGGGEVGGGEARGGDGRWAAMIPGPRLGESDDLQPAHSSEPDTDSLAAYLAVRLVEARLAAWGLDWLDGPVLRDMAGDPVPIHDMAAALADIGDVSRLSDWLARITR
ncbi:hypothetical protein [Catenulispora pinisilvae]|uniref:hypothetical protein n=1 Tax=Catenulispora pinisilvae TaxID=2705253 RepID=UPI00189178D1|nr:hypothetical protein [Catenulispora pinisilvae]